LRFSHGARQSQPWLCALENDGERDMLGSIFNLVISNLLTRQLGLINLAANNSVVPLGLTNLAASKLNLAIRPN
jgi:hypothetical protein